MPVKVDVASAVKVEVASAVKVDVASAVKVDVASAVKVQVEADVKVQVEADVKVDVTSDIPIPALKTIDCEFYWLHVLFNEIRCTKHVNGKCTSDTIICLLFHSYIKKQLTSICIG